MPAIRKSDLGGSPSSRAFKAQILIETTAMKVNFGDHTIEIEEKSNLIHLLRKQSLDQQNGIAVAVNNTVIPKTKWDALQLSDGDQITVIKATAGG